MMGQVRMTGTGPAVGTGPDDGTADVYTGPDDGNRSG